jgi:hypothetical protein
LSNRLVISTDDTFVLELAVNKRVSGMGKLVAYVVIRTPAGVWFSFLWNNGGFVMKRGLNSAASSAVIPTLRMPILNRKIAASLARGDYWFAAAIFHAGDRLTLNNWRDLAVYSAEVTVSVR